jgi:hypothetical protein
MKDLHSPVYAGTSTPVSNKHIALLIDSTTEGSACQPTNGDTYDLHIGCPINGTKANGTFNCLHCILDESNILSFRNKLKKENIAKLKDIDNE